MQTVIISTRYVGCPFVLRLIFVPITSTYSLRSNAALSLSRYALSNRVVKVHRDMIVQHHVQAYIQY
jgi:hypothetical protein